MLPAEKLSHLKLIDETDTDQLKNNQQNATAGRNAHHQQHSQSDSSPSYLHLTSQFNLQTEPDMPGDLTGRVTSGIQQVRSHQQVDLAMLRLAFRKIISDDHQDFEELNSQNISVRDNLSSSEFNQLVSAIVRLHNDERELFGIKPVPEDNQNDQYRFLEDLTIDELIELCYKEGIDPPPTCKTQPQTQHTNSASET